MRPEELAAKSRWEQATGRSLVEWDVDGRQNAVDFRCLDAPTVSLEVKLLTDQDVQRSTAIRSKRPAHDDGRLSRRWHVLVPHETPGPKPAEVVESLAALEAVGVWSTYQLGDSEEQRTALADWRQRWRAIQAQGHVVRDLAPGVDVGGVSTSVGRSPDLAASRIEQWLHSGSDHTVNLAKKLAASDDSLREGFLVTTSAIGFTFGFKDWTLSDLPNRQIALPEGIDAIWVTTMAEILQVTLPSSASTRDKAEAMVKVLKQADGAEHLRDSALLWRYDATGWQSWLVSP